MNNIPAEEIKRGDRFLAAYAVIEQELRKRWGVPGGRDSFRHMVEVLSKNDALIRRFREDLIEYSELRNAIVHERISPDYLIAVPLEDIVCSIERIAADLTKPPLVIPKFSRKVVVLDVSTPISEVLKLIRMTEYTQFPVYKGNKYVGLLTDGSIARWAAHAMDGLSHAPMEYDVAYLLRYEKRIDQAKFVSRTTTVYEAEEIFRNCDTGKDGKHRISAMLITETGEATRGLLGIITPSDILVSSIP